MLYPTPLSHYEAAKRNYRPARFFELDNYFMDEGMIRGKLPSHSKIGVIGDWGTGMQDAFFLLNDMLTRAPDISAVVHLGDIYESGLPHECMAHFKEPIEKIFAKKYPHIPFFAIPGNHEYFSAGGGYFSMIDTLNNGLEDIWQQKRSYFVIRSVCNNWQIIGLDTGLGSTKCHQQGQYCIPTVEYEEAKWAQKVIQCFSGKTILLTHHPFVSCDVYLNKQIYNDIKFFNINLLDTFWNEIDKIDLWLWGHDHWFIPFVKDLQVPQMENDKRKTPILKRGVLLGGSAREIKQEDRKILYKNGVEKNKEGHFIVPEITQDGLYNHTYAIINLGQSCIEYFQTPAWFGDATIPSANPIHNPIFSHSI